MKRCTAALPTTRSWQARRWASHDRSTLTPEALLEQVQSGLDEDTKIIPDQKKVSTPAGELPLSPVFDPAWIKSRRRERKPAGAPVSGRFRKKLVLNPYARALAQPLRVCSMTNATLPRYFLQDFEVIQHPESEQAWFAPGPAAFQGVVPTSRSDGDLRQHLPEGEQLLAEGEQHGRAGQSLQQAQEHKNSEAVELRDDAEANKNETRAAPDNHRAPRAPLTAYMLSRKDVLGQVDRQSKLHGRILGRRSGTATSAKQGKIVWRNDMGDFVLDKMRRVVVDALIARSDENFGPQTKFMEPVSDWDKIKDVRSRESVLCLRNKEARGDGHAVDDASAAALSSTTSEFATFDVDGAKYGSKMAVHDLYWLLGTTEVARLKESRPHLFDEHRLVVLKGGRRMVSIHQLLWRLHGYLAESKV